MSESHLPVVSSFQSSLMEPLDTRLCFSAAYELQLSGPSNSSGGMDYIKSAKPVFVQGVVTPGNIASAEALLVKEITAARVTLSGCNIANLVLAKKDIGLQSSHARLGVSMTYDSSGDSFSGGITVEDYDWNTLKPLGTYSTPPEWVFNIIPAKLDGKGVSPSVFTTNQPNNPSETFAVFTDPGLKATAFTAKIQWGDGSSGSLKVAPEKNSKGTILKDSSGNTLYAATGSHNYVKPGTFQTDIVISRNIGDTHDALHVKLQDSAANSKGEISKGTIGAHGNAITAIVITATSNTTAFQVTGRALAAHGGPASSLPITWAWAPDDTGSGGKVLGGTISTDSDTTDSNGFVQNKITLTGKGGYRTLQLKSGDNVIASLVIKIK